MSAHSEAFWRHYHATTARRPVREHLRRALDFVATDAARPRTAVDIGFGAGVEALYLLDQGWQLFGVDPSRSAARTLRAAMPADAACRATIRVAPIGKVRLPDADLIWAGLSLPFLAAEQIPTLWPAIVASLRPGGVFAGDFFGRRHAWAGSSASFCLGLADLRRLLRPLDLLSLTVERGARFSASRELFHSEMFTVIARLPPSSAGRG